MSTRVPAKRGPSKWKEGKKERREKARDVSFDRRLSSTRLSRGFTRRSGDLRSSILGSLVISYAAKPGVLHTVIAHARCFLPGIYIPVYRRDSPRSMHIAFASTIGCALIVASRHGGVINWTGCTDVYPDVNILQSRGAICSRVTRMKFSRCFSLTDLDLQSRLLLRIERSHNVETRNNRSQRASQLEHLSRGRSPLRDSNCSERSIRYSASYLIYRLREFALFIDLLNNLGVQPWSLS